ncbi:MAG: NAD(P)-binding domain-containing protein [Proteobacteria bacterium]|nr:NAD(P)-binding domain-containing protein [Pseudomonadota bacterium]
MKIGFIGLGIMGRHMASSLIKAGHELVVHDLRREAAARHFRRPGRSVPSRQVRSGGVRLATGAQGRRPGNQPRP